MPSFSATRRSEETQITRRIVILIYDGTTLLDATGPAQVFNSARENGGGEPSPYEIVLASSSGGMIETDTGIMLSSVSLAQAAAKPIDTLIIAGGTGIFAVTEDPGINRWVRQVGEKCRRVGSTCMGAFLTASAGLLSGKRATTHWRWCDELRRRHPEVTVEDDPIYVRDGNIWSSAGVSAGIDLALAMVEEDKGRTLALTVARSLVVYLKRPGGQSQFSIALTAQTDDRDGIFEPLLAWIADNLDADLRVERLAEFCRMSPRTFARLFAAHMGTTPAKTVERLRVEAAKRLLESGGQSVAGVARLCGLGDDQRLRRAFQRHVGTTPSEFQQRFGV